MKTVITTYGILGIMVVAILILKVWFFGSLATSAIKSLSGSCDKKYGIESVPVISGNWFCSKKN